MKPIITMVLLLYFSNSFSQWTRVQQLPSSDISGLYCKGNTLYAGGKSIIYFSSNKGRTWDSTNRIPQFSSVDKIVVYENELYAASFSFGVYKSVDGGITWKNINAGLFPFVSDFTEWKGNLYAATLGGSVFKLEPVNRNNWSSFNNGLSSLSLNLTSIASTNSTLVAGTLANGLYDYRSANSTTWKERFLLGQIKPSEGVYDIVTAHDSLFLSGHSGLFYLSTNRGRTWNIFGNSLSSTSTSLVNTKQALILSRGSFNGLNNTSFYYIKKNALHKSFMLFSAVPDHFTYKLEIFDDKLWDASTKGLFFMPLSALPGISVAADSINQISMIRSSSPATNVLSLWPNPFQDNLFINIVATGESQALIKLFNSNGTLVKVQKATVLQGGNQFSVDMKSLVNGVYHLSIEWNNGKLQKSMQIMKQ